MNPRIAGQRTSSVRAFDDEPREIHKSVKSWTNRTQVSETSFNVACKATIGDVGVRGEGRELARRVRLLAALARADHSRAPAGYAAFPPTVPRDHVRSIAAPRDRWRVWSTVRSTGKTSLRRSAERCAASARTTASPRAPVAVLTSGRPPSTKTGRVPSPGHGNRARRSAMRLRTDRDPAQGRQCLRERRRRRSAVRPK